MSSEKQEQKKRIYGEDTGSLTEESIKSFKKLLEDNPKKAELWAYFVFNELDAMCFQFNRVLPGGKDLIPHTPENWENFWEINYARYWVVGQTKHFGITFEQKEGCEPVYMSESFQKWYDFWHNYFESLPKYKWNKFEKAYNNDEDLTPYLPKKKNGTRNNSFAQKTKIRHHDGSFSKNKKIVKKFFKKI